MPRGRGSSGGRGSKSGHKGQRRHFTSPEQLEASKEKEERERQWRKQRGDESEESEEEVDGKPKDKDKDKDNESGSSSEESESSSGEEEEAKAKGIQHLIEIENPNRVIKKTKKVEHLTLDDAKNPQQLSRKEREELEKQRAKANYQKLHAAGKTDEARQDLARLALIRKQREDAAKKREEERLSKS